MRGEAGERTARERAAVATNGALAAGDRDWLAARRVLAVQVVGRPRAGTTTLLERTAADLGREERIVVVGKSRATATLDPAPGSIVMIEAGWDVGTRAQVVIASVTDDADVPVRHPQVLRPAALALLTKIDLLPHVRFDVARFMRLARAVNPRLTVLPVSATRGDGLGRWYAWLRAARLGACTPP